MKITQVALAQVGDHEEAEQLLHVSLRFSMKADLGAFINAAQIALRAGTELPALAITDQTVSGDTTAAGGETHLAEDNPNPEDTPDAPPPVTRRRRVNPLDVANETEAAPSAQASPPQSDAAVSRRRRTTPEATPPAAEPAATPPAQAPAGRRRAVNPEAPSSAPPTAASPSDVAPGSEITDADLSKAASNAARTLLPAGVKAVLTKMGVASTNELKGQARRDFINTLKALVAKDGRGEK